MKRMSWWRRWMAKSGLRFLRWSLPNLQFTVHVSGARCPPAKCSLFMFIGFIIHELETRR